MGLEGHGPLLKDKNTPFGDNYCKSRQVANVLRLVSFTNR